MDLLTDAERLARLARDLRIVDANGGQAPITLVENAPILTSWRPVVTLSPAFTGIVTGHPRLVDGRLIQTSQVFARGEGWIRTLSRFYLLSGTADS